MEPLNAYQLEQMSEIVSVYLVRKLAEYVRTLEERNIEVADVKTKLRHIGLKIFLEAWVLTPQHPDVKWNKVVFPCEVSVTNSILRIRHFAEEQSDNQLDVGNSINNFLGI